MAIYQVVPDDEYCWAIPVGSKIYKYVYDLPWPIGEAWAKPSFDKWHGKSRLEGDFLWFGQGGVIANDRVRQLLQGSGIDSLEFLPVVVENEDLWLARVEAVADVLDYSKSDIDRIPPDMRIIIVKRYVS